MSYLDDLSQWSALAQVKIADLSIELAQARADSQNTGALIDEICWYTLLLTGANDTTQEDDLRLELLTLLVDGARLGPLSTAVGVYNLYQPISPTSVATVPFNLVTGDILSNASAAAQFALVLYKSGGTMTGPLLIDPTTRIDSTGALNIGTSTATTTTIGRVGQNVAMPGTITLATWGGVAIPIAKGGTGVSAVGTAGQVLATNGAANGTEWITPAGSPVGVYLPLAGGTMTGPLLMTAGIAIDAATAGALSFGATTATTITIGRATQTVNFPGTIGSGLWNGTVIGRPYGGFGNAMANVPGGDFLYGYDVGDDESQFWTVGSRLTYGTQELNVNPALVLTSVTASSFLQAGTASSATGQLRLAHASTANLTTITAGNAASALTFVWPVVNPTIGQLLTASAPSGSTVTLSWSSALTNPLDNVGQLIYGGVAGAPTRLAGDTSNTRKFLRELSVASVATAPVWDTLLAADIPTIAQSQVSGLTTALANKLGTGLTDGYFFVGNAANAAVEVLMSQDGTLDNTGALTIADAAVTFAKMQDITYQTLMGRWSAGDGPPQEIAIGSGLTLSGAGVLSASGGGSGDVVGPASATDNAVARFDTGTGKLIQNSVVTIADTTGAIAGAQSITLGVASATAGTVVLQNATNAFTQTIRGTNPAASIVYDLPTTAPTVGQILSASAPSGGVVTLSWATGGGGGTPGGSTTELQWNNAGSFGGISRITTDGTDTTALAANFWIADNSDPTKIAKFDASAITAATTRTFSFPDVTGTLTVLGNTTTGSGSIVLATSPTLVTPLLGTPTSGVLTNTTGYLLSSLAAGTAGNTINNADFAQEWQWNTLAAGTGMKFSSSSTAAASNTNKVVEIVSTGTNASSGQTTYGLYVNNGKAGTSGLHIGAYFGASVVGGPPSGTYIAAHFAGSVYFDSGFTLLQASTAAPALQLSAAASGVNYVSISGTATGSGPTVGATGSDTNVDFNLATKGSGVFKFTAALNPTATALDLGAAATAWRSLYVHGSGTYGSHSIQVTGAPTGNRVATLPDTTTTLAGLAVTQTFTLGNTFSLSGATGSAITISGAGNTTNAGLIFSGSTNQWINMGSNGVAAPAFTTRSLGTKVVLFPLVGASTLDYAMGINTNILWFSVPDSARSFQWFSTITTPIMTLTGFGNITIGQRVGTSLALVGFTYTGAVNTGQTASTEIPTALWTCAGRQWATGSFTTQREFHITSPTYTAVGASVINDAYTFYVGAGPTASTNMTVTRAWSGGFNGLVAINTGLYLGGLTTAPTAFLHIAAGTTAKAQIRFVNGAAPSAPNDGDLWFDGTDLFLRVSGVTKTFTLV